MTFDVLILGSNSSIPAHGRHPTAQVVNHNDQLFLVDCGEGTQMRMDALRVRRSRIHHIFISHLHGDHYYGLIGLLTTFHLLQRRAPLHIFSPPGLEEIIHLHFRYSETQLVYPVHFHTFSGQDVEQLYESETLVVSTLPMQHRIPCCGFLFREKPMPRRIRPDAVERYRLQPEHIRLLREGKDLEWNGSFWKNEDLTLDPLPPAVYACCSDTRYDESLAALIAGADLLYHEATFLSDLADRAALTHHSTAAQAAELARKAGVSQLLLGHFGSRYTHLDPVLKEARAVFPNTRLALEGQRFAVRQAAVAQGSMNG
ncbi:MAG: ribonuclease Z [Chitinophagales bacterium]|nr:ribonuclease Z [Chitinophagales bacterium]MDW8392917.1 ribonuclease Z [Chitinophagales bacterium]